MKTNLSVIIIAAAALLIAASCTKQESFEMQEKEQSSGDGQTFTAVIEQGFTKTTLTEANKVYWEAGDRVNINGAEYSAIPKNPASRAVFQHMNGPVPATGPYKAIFPASLYNAKNGGMEFPSTITYKDGGLNTPMYAESSTEELCFKNICGVLHLALTVSDTVMVAKRVIVSANERISGPFEVTFAADGSYDVNFSGLGNTVTIKCDEGVTLNNTTKHFYIPVPEGDYTKGFTITVDSSDGKEYVKTTGNTVTINRGTLYSFEWDVNFTFPTLDNVYKQLALLIGSKQPGREYVPYRTLYSMCGDDVCAADAYGNGYDYIARLNDFTYDANNEVVYNCYTNFYRAIDVCNKFLNGYCNETGTAVDTVKTKGLDMPKVLNEIAQVRTLRAWLHVTLAQGWGNPPLIKTYPAPENPTNSSEKEILNWSIKEIEESVPKLYERLNRDDKAGVLRVTRGFAQAICGKAAIFAGDLNKAIEKLKPLVESGNYALVSGASFYDLFHKNGNGCQEKIFELDMASVSDIRDYAGMETKLWACNDDRFVASPWGRDQVSKSAWGLGPGVDYVHAFLGNDGDSYRRKATFLTSDEVFYDSTLTSYDIDGFDDLTLDQKQHHPGIGIKADGLYGQCDLLPGKLVVSAQDANGAGVNETNFTVMRLGEAYLLYAEACCNKGVSGEAKKYVNMIQERAGSKTVSDFVDMDVIKAEKKYELWMEGCRWADIVRWGDLNKVAVAGIQVPKAEDEYTTSEGVTPHKLRYELVNVKSTGSFDPEKHTRFPYPAAVISHNPNLQQNPGW